MRALAAWVIFIAALMGEGLVMNPIQVEELKLVTLCNAVEDAREVLDFCQRLDCDEVPEIEFRATRVLGLLEDMRNREAGRVS